MRLYKAESPRDSLIKDTEPVAKKRCWTCGKWFMSWPQVKHHADNADRLCKR